MKKKLSFILAILMVLSVMIAGFTPAFADGHGDYDTYRLSGANRYQTAHEIAKVNFDEANTVILVRGDHIDGVPQVVDGLTASGLAGSLDAPILLTPMHRLHPDTVIALEDLNAVNIVIIGGPAAISEKVETDLENAGYFTRRVQVEEGNRYSTAAAVAREMGTAVADTAIITSGNDANLVDSLVAGPLAHQGHPILLVNNRRGGVLPEVTKEAIKDLGIKNVLIVGGTSAVPETIEKALEDMEGVTVAKRFSGADGGFQDTGRVGTSLHIGNFEAFAGVDEAFLVNGDNFVDAVAASTLGKPVVYFRRHLNDEVKEFLSAKNSFKALGGSVTIPNTILEALIEARLAYATDAFHTAAANIVGSQLIVDSTVYGEITAYTDFHVTVGLADQGLIENADEIFDALMNVIEDLGVVEVTLEGQTFVLADTHGSEIVSAMGFETASKLRSEGVTISALVDMEGAASFREDFHFDFDDL